MITTRNPLPGNIYATPAFAGRGIVVLFINPKTEQVSTIITKGGHVERFGEFRPLNEPSWDDHRHWLVVPRNWVLVNEKVNPDLLYRAGDDDIVAWNRQVSQPSESKGVEHG